MVEMSNASSFTCSLVISDQEFRRAGTRFFLRSIPVAGYAYWIVVLPTMSFAVYQYGWSTLAAVMFTAFCVCGIYSLRALELYRNMAVKAVQKYQDRTFHYEANIEGISLMAESGMTMARWPWMRRLYKFADMWLLHAGGVYYIFLVNSMPPEMLRFIEDRVYRFSGMVKCHKCKHDLKATRAAGIDRCSECGEQVEKSMRKAKIIQ